MVNILQNVVKQGAKVINLSGIVGNPGDAALAEALPNASQSVVLVVTGNTASNEIFYLGSEPKVIAVKP